MNKKLEEISLKMTECVMKAEWDMKVYDIMRQGGMTYEEIMMMEEESLLRKKTL